ncbi:hypothetical protein WJD25_23965, partial [Salmonella enterica subsp. enterica serovar Corvallis]
SALTDARKTLAYDFFRILRAPLVHWKSYREEHMDRIKYLKWIAEESPTDDEIDNYDSIISRGAERAEKVQLSLRR